MRRVSFVLATAFALCLAMPAASQNYYYVSPTGMPGAAGTCEFPLNTIGEAITAASDDMVQTEIRIAAGTYGEASLTIDFSDVAVKGGYDPTTLGGGCDDVTAEAGRDPFAFVTTIDAAAAAMQDRIFDVLPNIDDMGTPGDPTDDVFVSSNVNITFDGLNLVNGIPMRMLANGQLGGGAGAMLVLNCDNVVLSNNVIRDNRSNNHGFVGGAVYFATYATDIGEFHPGTMTLDSNLFEDNSTGNGSNASGWGGAFAARDFNSDGATVARGTVVNAVNNIFRGNISSGSINLAPAGLCTPNQDCAPADGAADTCGVQALGGGVYLQNALGVWQGNLFEANQASPVSSVRYDQTGWGGGMAIFSSGAQVAGGASPDIVENTFLGNQAHAPRGDLSDCGWFAGWGGGIFAVQFDGLVAGNLFQGNRAEGLLQDRAPYSGRGGGVFVAPTGSLSGGQVARFTANTFDSNIAEVGGSWVGGWGGGLHVNEQFGNAGDPVITNNTFVNNRAYTDASYYRAAYGGGLQFTSSGNYPLVARNVFENNDADRGPGVAGALVALGGAGHFRIQTDDGVVAENIVRFNTATPLSETPPNPNLTSFSGFVFGMTPFDNSSDPRGPLVQNNLIVDNGGVGLSVQGLWADGLEGDEPMTGPDDISEPEELFIHAPTIRNNTIANNAGVGLVTNLFENGILESNIIWGNDSNGANFGNWFDNWLCSEGDGMDDCIDHPSVNLTVAGNVLQDFPVNQMDAVIDPMTMMPANGNRVGEDPLFLDGVNPDPLLRNYHLEQQPDQAVTSPAVDRGPVGAIARDYSTPRNFMGRDVDGDGDPSNDNLFNRTTNDPGGRPDVFFVDAGYHYPLDPAIPIVDTDGDGVPDDVEMNLQASDPAFSCLDPNDADSDDDGIPDGLDVGADIDGDGSAAACDCDTDGDGLTDGRESDISMPDGDTDVMATCDTSNAPLGCGDPNQPAYVAGTGAQTDPLNPDTDGGGEYDGCEINDYGCGLYGLVPMAQTRDPNVPDDDDQDHDCVNDGLETGFLGTDPQDADTDDDGIADGLEATPPDFNDFTAAVVCDTDADFLPDGLERALICILSWSVSDPSFPDLTVELEDMAECMNAQTILGADSATLAARPPVADPDGPSFPGIGTDITAGCDSDGDMMDDGPSYVVSDPFDPNFNTTWAAVDIFIGAPGRGEDSDGDGCLDGEEDKNRDGIFQPDGEDGIPGNDDDETDPGVADCFAAANLLINGGVTALTGGSAECGAGTNPPMADLLDASARCMPIPQPSDYSVTCPAPRVDTMAGGGLAPIPWTGMELRLGEADPGAFDGATGTGVVLVLYEVDNCDQTIFVSKQGSDLLIEGM